MGAKVIHGDCIEAMREMPANSIDSIVTDPPYGLGFMGKKWDDLPPGLEWAEECLRVLKPGGHLLAFGGTRTWHRLAVAIEDAGFEMRDSIAWLYGSGFPKHRAALKPAFEPVVMARKPFKGSLIANEAVYGTGALDIDGCRLAVSVDDDIHAKNPHTKGGFGHGDASIYGDSAGAGAYDPTAGRWPANVILDEGMAEVLDGQSGPLHTQDPATRYRAQDPSWSPSGTPRGTHKESKQETGGLSEKGTGASRFFYCAKAPKRERPVVDGVSHPTVKPLNLMRYLVKLITPPSGTVLEPFAGSGATVEACMLEGFDVIAIERELEYIPLIEARIERTAAA